MISVHLNYNNIISYVTYLNGIDLVNTFTITNNTDQQISEVNIQIKFQGEIAKTWVCDPVNIEENSTVMIDFSRNNILLNLDTLMKTTEGYASYFTVSILSKSLILYEERFDVNVYSYEQWMGSNYHPRLITSFVTPNHPLISEIIGNAANILRGWNKSFSGYSTNIKEDVLSQTIDAR